tara:strand:- start:213 stop:527 length:315 start_codon:yes stop_codon:yes gene_type:complete
MTVDEQRALGRLEGKVDSQTESLAGLHSKLDQVVTKGDCEDHRARDDARHGKTSERLHTVELRIGRSAEQHAGWLGSWRAVVVGAGAVFAVLGLLAAVGLLKLH